MAQQTNLTAVEWLINELIFKQEYEHLPNNYFLMSDKDIDKIIQQAKQMEKEQIMKAYDDGVEYEISIYSTMDSEQYYNETYKK